MIDHLPEDVLLCILRMLSGEQIARISMTSTYMHQLATQVHPWLRRALALANSEKVPTDASSYPVQLDGRVFEYQHSLDSYANIEYWSNVCVAYAPLKKQNGLHEVIRNELVKREHALRTSRQHPTTGLTAEQQRVVSQRPRRQIMVVQAFAGTGKTTTLYHYAKKWTAQRMLYLAYNKSLAEESKRRFRELSNVRVMTIHSMALRNVDPEGVLSLGNLKLNTIQTFFGNELQGTDEAKRVLTAFDVYCSSATLDDPEHPHVRRLWDAMFHTRTMDVTHDAYLKQFQKSLPILSHYDVILLDEVQDCTDCILHIIKRQVHATRVFVGDVYQKIYGFRHVNDPFQYVLTTNHDDDCRVMCFQLSVSFRMGYDLMHYTNIYLKRAYHSPMGFSYTRRTQNTSLTTFDTHTDSLAGLERGTVVLCRYNANVLQLMFKLCALQISYDFYGKTICFEKEASIITDLHHIHTGAFDRVTVPKLKPFRTIAQVQEHFAAISNNAWKDRLRLYNLHGEDLIRMWDQARQLQSHDNPHIVITTAHQSKGSEFDYVVLYDDFPMNNEDAYNTLYVAMTRAKKRLYLNNSLFTFFTKRSKRVVYDDMRLAQSSFAECVFCNHVKTNQSICVESDPKGILEGEGCNVYEYVPICNLCKRKVIC